MKQGLDDDSYYGEPVITLSEWCESPGPAIKSILRNPGYFRGGKVHLVHYGYDTTREYYPGFGKDVEALRAAGFTLVWHSEFDPSKVTPRQLVVHIPPDAQVMDGALDMLYEDVCSKHGRNCLFAVSSVTYLKNDEESWPEYFASFSYGFLLVIMMLDAFRYITHLGGYQRHNADLRAQTLTTTYPNRTRLTTGAWWRGWVWSSVSITRFGDAALLQAPSRKDGGVQFVMRFIKTHNHMGMGPWVIFLYAVYYVVFAVPWWVRFGSSTGISPLDAILFQSRLSTFWLVLYAAHALTVWGLASRHMEFPSHQLPIQCLLLYPLYLTVSPVIFVAARFYRSTASWKRCKSE